MWYVNQIVPDQWAGLFQSFLQQKLRQSEFRLSEKMSVTAETLNRLVTFLTEDRNNSEQATKDILSLNHPAFAQLREMTGTPYRFVFSNKEELREWVSARGYEEDIFAPEEFLIWTRESGGKRYKLNVSEDIFDDDQKLKVFDPNEWDSDWITLEIETVPSDLDDEIPF